MTELFHNLQRLAPWLGMALLAPIFLANALGVLDQSVAARELAATGIPSPLARAAIGVGRLVQLLGTPLLFCEQTRLPAAMALAVFLIGATLAAHPFWRAPAPDRDRQLANFLKNVAIVGGLLLAAGLRH